MTRAPTPPSELQDYAALGYPETELWETRENYAEDTLQLVVDIWAAGPVWPILTEMVVVAPL
jgi:hypothetical protein